MIFKYDLTLKKSHCIGWDGEGWIYDDDEEIDIENYEYEVSDERIKKYEGLDYSELKDEFKEEAQAKAQEELDEGWIY